MPKISSRMLFLVVFFASAISVAHEQKAAFTDVFYNERTGNLEIAHRFSLHDAEHTLHKAPEMTADLTKSEEAQAAFADYVAARFKLRFADKTVIPLTLVGQERERGYFWVYQEAKIPKPIGKAFLIEKSILQEVVKGQVNTVNVRYRSQVTTFVFKEGSGGKVYEGPVEAGPKE